jgi:hypothetical protein
MSFFAVARDFESSPTVYLKKHCEDDDAFLTASKIFFETNAGEGAFFIRG